MTSRPLDRRELNNHPVSLKEIYGQYVGSSSRYWLFTPRLQLQISNYPNFPRCWVDTDSTHLPKISSRRGSHQRRLPQHELRAPHDHGAGILYVRRYGAGGLVLTQQNYRVKYILELDLDSGIKCLLETNFTHKRYCCHGKTWNMLRLQIYCLHEFTKLRHLRQYIITVRVNFNTSKLSTTA